MKVKRLVILALAVLLAFGALFALSACGGGEAHTHTMVHHEAKAPSCNQIGSIECWSCSGCGKFLGSELTVGDAMLFASGCCTIKIGEIQGKLLKKVNGTSSLKLGKS